PAGGPRLGVESAGAQQSGAQLRALRHVASLGRHAGDCGQAAELGQAVFEVIVDPAVDRGEVEARGGGLHARFRSDLLAWPAPWPCAEELPWWSSRAPPDAWRR